MLQITNDFCAFLSIECSPATGCKHKRIMRYSNVLVLNISLLFGLVIIQTLKPRYIAVSIWVEAGACKWINDTFTNVVVIYTQTVYSCPKSAFLVNISCFIRKKVIFFGKHLISYNKCFFTRFLISEKEKLTGNISRRC